MRLLFRRSSIEQNLWNGTLKKGIQRKDCNECLICFEIHQKTRHFENNSFLGYLGQSEEQWRRYSARTVTQQKY